MAPMNMKKSPNKIDRLFRTIDDPIFCWLAELGADWRFCVFCDDVILSAFLILNLYFSVEYWICMLIYYSRRFFLPCADADAQVLPMNRLYEFRYTIEATHTTHSFFSFRLLFFRLMMSSRLAWCRIRFSFIIYSNRFSSQSITQSLLMKNNKWFYIFRCTRITNRLDCAIFLIQLR